MAFVAIVVAAAWAAREYQRRSDPVTPHDIVQRDSRQFADRLALLNAEQIRPLLDVIDRWATVGLFGWSLPGYPEDALGQAAVYAIEESFAPDRMALLQSHLGGRHYWVARRVLVRAGAEGCAQLPAVAPPHAALVTVEDPRERALCEDPLRTGLRQPEWSRGLVLNQQDRRPQPRLDDASSDERWVAFWSLDRAQMVESLDVLIEMARTEPDAELRREVVRQLGYTRDPRVLPVLESLLDGPDRSVAYESLGYYGPEGCELFAADWLARHDSESVQWALRLRSVDADLDIALHVAVPQCVTAFSRLCPPEFGPDMVRVCAPPRRASSKSSMEEAP